MLLRWNDLAFAGFEPRFPAFDALRVLRSFDQDVSAQRVWQGPRLQLRDLGEELRVSADLPGYKQEDLQISYEQQTLVIRGQRGEAAPEGYAAQRQERTERTSFARKIALPVRVAADQIVASLKDGVLELRMPKLAADRPRTIAVNAS